MKEIEAFVVNSFRGGFILGIHPSKRVRYLTKRKLKLGQKVWVSWDFTRNELVRVTTKPGVESDPPELDDGPPTPSHPNEDITAPSANEMFWFNIDHLGMPEFEEEADEYYYGDPTPPEA